jgi:hypothetical protein
LASSSWRPCSSSPSPRCSRHRRPQPTRCSPACATPAARARRRPPCATAFTSGAASGPRGIDATTTTTGPSWCRCRCRRPDATEGRRSTCATASPSGSCRRGPTRCTTAPRAAPRGRGGRGAASSWFLGRRVPGAVGGEHAMQAHRLVGLSCSCFPASGKDLQWRPDRRRRLRDNNRGHTG